MDQKPASPLLLFLRLSRPFFLLGGVLLYALGVGVAHYLGRPIDPGLYLLGQAMVTLLQLATHYLNEYFDAPEDEQNPNRTPFTGGSGALGEGKLPRIVALQAAMACLAVLASLTVLLLVAGHLTPVVIVLLALGCLGAILYSTPPVRLSGTGYGELTTAIVVANLVPAFAYALQTGELHRLLAMATFPLTILMMAMLLAFELPDYATDLKYRKLTLMVRAGWEAGMQLHNYLVLGAFFLLALASTFGLALEIALPAFLTLPIGLLQIWQMRRLGQGAAPNWRNLTLTALILFASMAYLLAFGFWTS